MNHGVEIKIPPSISVHFKPWMIECAWQYMRLSVSEDCLSGAVKAALSALALEILLKSFSSVVADNHGMPNERYVFNKPKSINAHNLTELMSLLPKDVESFLFNHFDKTEIDSCSGDFVSQRYIYERGVRISHSDELCKIAAKAIIFTIALYKKRGCTDSFISNFDISGNYQKYVRTIVMC